MDVSSSSSSLVADRQIILMVGRKGSGKTTGTDAYIAQNPHKRVVEIALANAVKEQLTQKFPGWTMDMLGGKTPESRKAREEPEAKWTKLLKRPVIPREEMVTHGNLMRTTVSSDYWLIIAQLWIDDNSKPGDNIIVSDARYVNEVNYFLAKYANVLICSIVNPRVVAPYTHLLEEIIEKERERTRNPLFLPRLEIIEAFLYAKDVFKVKAEESEWQTALMQLTHFGYNQYAHGSETSQRVITLRNDGTKDEFIEKIKTTLVF